MATLSSGNPLLNLPASTEQIEATKNELGIELPDDLISIWRESNGLSFPNSGIVIYSTSDISERNATYEVVHYAPELLLIGDDSGGNGFFVSSSSNETDVLKIDFGALGSTEGSKVGKELLFWVQLGCPDDESSSDSLKKESINSKVDIVLNNAPKEGLKGLLLIKQKLSLQDSASQLKGYVTQVPKTLLKNVYMSKYKKLVEEINQTQACIVFIPVSK